MPLKKHTAGWRRGASNGEALCALFFHPGEGTGQPECGQQIQRWSRKSQGVRPLIRVGWDGEGPQGLCVKGSPCASETIALCPRMVMTTLMVLIMINNNNNGNNNKFSKAVYRIEAITDLI